MRPLSAALHRRADSRPAADLAKQVAFGWWLCIALLLLGPSSPLTAQDASPTSETSSSTAPSTQDEAAPSPQTSPPPPPEPVDEGPSFILVINAKNEVEELDTSRISKMFLKKVKRWPDKDKTSVEPVDQVESSPIREEFTRAIHNKDLFAVKSYWQRMIFSGRMAPPPELRNDAEVLSFVRSRPGAIGYVQRGTDLGDGVKELKITPDD